MKFPKLDWVKRIAKSLTTGVDLGFRGAGRLPGEGKNAKSLIEKGYRAYDAVARWVDQKLVSGQSGANGPSATPLHPMARSSDSATASMLLRLLPVMATQLRRLHALMLGAAQTLCRASERQNPFAKTPPVQVDFVTFGIK